MSEDSLPVGISKRSKGIAVTEPRERGTRLATFADEQEPISTPERILAAAREMFARRGFEQTSMGAIAKSAGVSRATVYNNFADKQEILWTLVGRYMHGYVEIGQRLMEQIDGSQTIFEHLEVLLREGLFWRTANHDLRPAVQMAKSLRGSGWLQASSSSDQVWEEWIRVILKASQRANLIRDELDFDLAARTSFAMFETTLSNFEVSGDASLVHHVAHQVALTQWFAVFAVAPQDSPSLSSVLSNRQIARQINKARRLAASV